MLSGVLILFLACSLSGGETVQRYPSAPSVFYTENQVKVFQHKETHLFRLDFNDFTEKLLKYVISSDMTSPYSDIIKEKVTQLKNEFATVRA